MKSDELFRLVLTFVAQFNLFKSNTEFKNLFKLNTLEINDMFVSYLIIPKSLKLSFETE